MKNNLDTIIKERLENRIEWRNYLGWSLTHRYFFYVCDRHKFDMIETEIRMLKGDKHDEKK